MRIVEAYNGRDADTLFIELATPDFEWWPAMTTAYEGRCCKRREGVEQIAAETRQN